MHLRAAYAVCRHVTRKAARNFYYAFLVLPRRKRDALSAVYAFMRHADDISDDPQLPLEEKRTRLEQCLTSLRRVLEGEHTDDPVLLALADTQRRFKIPPELLEKLVYGTAMDVVAPAPQDGQPLPEESGQASGEVPAPAVLYRTFDELCQYCYYVASVVGLVCIRIFGYRDPAAEPLAERCGIAFQLTNIIRDVKEDASMGRIYLPQEDLERFGVTPAFFSNGNDPARLRDLLAQEADRAREFYGAANELLQMIDHESRPALWTLVEIYRRLLEKIAARNYDVFSERVQLTTREKLGVLSRGWWRRLKG